MEYATTDMSRKTRNPEGTVLLEFTLVALLFFMVLFGIVEFGFLLYNQQVITNAGREAARFGIVARPNGMEIPDTAIENEARYYAESHIVSFGAKNFNANASFNTGLTYCDQFQDILTVDVSYDYSFLFLPFATKTLRTRAVMYCE